MVRAIGVIQGRMASTRLPGKLLAPLAGQPLLEVLVRRTRAAAVDEWWLATSDAASDDVAAAWGEELGLRVLRGDPDDVLSRFVAVIGERRPAWVVRLTADSPFVDAAIVDELLAQGDSLPAGVDHLADDPGEGRLLPRGYVPELVQAAALEEIAAGELAPHHRVHVTSGLVEAGRSAWLTLPDRWPHRGSWRWTVDTQADLAMARAAFAAFGDRWPDIGYRDMVSTFDARPDIGALNAGERQKALTEG
jgi:spore coat polysaccharide biosynthesis protein SpsF